MTQYRHAVRSDLDPFARNCLTNLASQHTGIAHFEHHQHLPQHALDEIAKGSDALDVKTGMSITLRPHPDAAGVGLNLMSQHSAFEFAQLRLEYESAWRAWSQLVYAGLGATAPDIPSLTPRQRDCLAYAADGLRGSEIAFKMNISESTVELHMREARARLGAATRDHAVAIAVRARLI